MRDAMQVWSCSNAPCPFRPRAQGAAFRNQVTVRDIMGHPRGHPDGHEAETLEQFLELEVREHRRASSFPFAITTTDSSFTSAAGSCSRRPSMLSAQTCSALRGAGALFGLEALVGLVLGDGQGKRHAAP